MIRVTNRLFNLIAIFLAVFMLQTVHAEQAPMPASTAGALAIQLPDVDRGVLIEQLRLLRSQLIQRKQARVSADIEEYSGDLLVMQSGSVPVLVARQY